MRWVSRTALNPSYEIHIFRFFVPGRFVPPGSSLLLSFRSPTDGMAERRSAAHTFSQRLRLPQVTSKAYFSSLVSSSSRLYHPQGTSSSTGIGLGVDARLEQAFRLLRANRSPGRPLLRWRQSLSAGCQRRQKLGLPLSASWPPA